jgi:hypothetical protein
MPTKPLSVRYEDDLRLLSSRWRQAGVVLLVLFARGGLRQLIDRSTGHG